jgi:putative ABC transport system substrate-binding protein
LSEFGYVEGRNVRIEYRWAETHLDHLPALAADLVNRRVTVIAAFSDSAAQAAKAATKTIPIVFSIGGDPVNAGLVESIKRPGGNMTGTSLISSGLRGKRVEMLRKVARDAGVLAHFVNPASPVARDEVNDVEAAARALGWTVKVYNISSEDSFEGAFASFAQEGIGALIAQDAAIFNNQQKQLAVLTARFRVPALFIFRDFPAAGGLMSYGPSLPDVYRNAAPYVARILEGEKPAVLPVVLPTKYLLVINLKTAQTLGLTIPSDVLALADEVFE